MAAFIAPEQLPRTSKEQIIATLSTYSKHELALLITGSETYADPPICTWRKDGQIKSQVDVTRDISTGRAISSREISWTYYKSGEVDIITTIYKDTTGKETLQHAVKHFTDGRQPIFI